MEKEKSDRKRKSGWKILLLLSVMLLMVLSIVLYTAYWKEKQNRQEAEELELAYNQAEEMVFSGQYDEAKEQLEIIRKKRYKDTTSLYYYVLAQIKYSNGDYSGAWRNIGNEEFSYQSEEHLTTINNFKEKVYREYQIQKEKEEQERQEALDQKIANGVPFVGMPESRINDTLLGRHSSKTDPGTYTTGGKTYSAVKYRWYSGTNLIYTAKCSHGSVVEVWDHRDAPINMSTVGQKNNTSSNQSSEDEFDVDAFSHPEDFYDWYYDDFYNLEEAEDYYYSHGGK